MESVIQVETGPTNQHYLEVDSSNLNPALEQHKLRKHNQTQIVHFEYFEPPAVNNQTVNLMVQQSPRQQKANENDPYMSQFEYSYFDPNEINNSASGQAYQSGAPQHVEQTGSVRQLEKDENIDFQPQRRHGREPQEKSDSKIVEKKEDPILRNEKVNVSCGCSIF
ncbi:hypothetical protein FGO68_gene6160 [Halteria grandinella]|uniref:Uncharacterized protein n=1 Tax=Halteria grandinella TaxID=5974 RepID=A0A8J8NI23_HALGN|nr:hypothetical protein FGO68_gene6160 [Halteria grandinella]